MKKMHHFPTNQQLAPFSETHPRVCTFLSELWSEIQKKQSELDSTSNAKTRRQQKKSKPIDHENKKKKKKKKRVTRNHEIQEEEQQDDSTHINTTKQKNNIAIDDDINQQQLDPIIDINVLCDQVEQHIENIIEKKQRKNHRVIPKYGNGARFLVHEPSFNDNTLINKIKKLIRKSKNGCDEYDDGLGLEDAFSGRRLKNLIIVCDEKGINGDVLKDPQYYKYWSEVKIIKIRELLLDLNKWKGGTVSDIKECCRLWNFSSDDLQKYKSSYHKKINLNENNLNSLSAKRKKTPSKKLRIQSSSIRSSIKSSLGPDGILDNFEEWVEANYNMSLQKNADDTKLTNDYSLMMQEPDDYWLSETMIDRLYNYSCDDTMLDEFTFINPYHFLYITQTIWPETKQQQEEQQQQEQKKNVLFTGQFSIERAMNHYWNKRNSGWANKKGIWVTTNTQPVPTDANNPYQFAGSHWINMGVELPRNNENKITAPLWYLFDSMNQPYPKKKYYKDIILPFRGFLKYIFDHSEHKGAKIPTEPTQINFKPSQIGCNDCGIWCSVGLGHFVNTVLIEKKSMKSFEETGIVINDGQKFIELERKKLTEMTKHDWNEWQKTRDMLKNDPPKLTEDALKTWEQLQQDLKVNDYVYYQGNLGQVLKVNENQCVEIEDQIQKNQKSITLDLKVTPYKKIESYWVDHVKLHIGSMTTIKMKQEKCNDNNSQPVDVDSNDNKNKKKSGNNKNKLKSQQAMDVDNNDNKNKKKSGNKKNKLKSQQAMDVDNNDNKNKKKSSNNRKRRRNQHKYQTRANSKSPKANNQEDNDDGGYTEDNDDDSDNDDDDNDNDDDDDPLKPPPNKKSKPNNNILNVTTAAN